METPASFVRVLGDDIEKVYRRKWSLHDVYMELIDLEEKAIEAHHLAEERISSLQKKVQELRDFDLIDCTCEGK